MGPADLAQLITSGTAVVALTAAYAQLRATHGQARGEATHAYIARITDADFSKHLVRSIHALKASTADDEDIVWSRFLALAPEDRADIAVPFNAFEAVAGLYNLSRIDRRVVEHQLEHTARAVFAEIEWWVRRVRAQEQRYFCEWERMLGWFAERRLRGAWHTSRP